MALTQQQKNEVWAQYMHDLSAANIASALLKQDMKDAVANIDAWVESNQASFNAALPVPYRNGASAADKARLLALVVMKRFGG